MVKRYSWLGVRAFGCWVIAAILVLGIARVSHAGLSAPTRNAVVGSASDAQTGAAAGSVFGVLQGIVASPDGDQDGVPDWSDNCPDVANADQTDSDGDGVGDVCDNCPNDFNPAQTDDAGDGIGDLCERDVSSTVFTLKLVRLRVNSARPSKIANGKIVVHGVLDPTQFGEPLLDTLDRGLLIGVSGAGLTDTETMVFQDPHCFQLSTGRVRCIGLRGEVANFTRQRRTPHFYNVSVTAPQRTFLKPLSAAPVRVVLSNSGTDRRADLATCKVYAQRIAGCRKPR
jgi:Thrombospondin type 3 repeat